MKPKSKRRVGRRSPKPNKMCWIHWKTKSKGYCRVWRQFVVGESLVGSYRVIWSYDWGIRLFKGVVQKSQNNKDIARGNDCYMYLNTRVDSITEWVQTKRQANTRTVMIDGFSVARESVGNDQWTAVKTLTSNPLMVQKLSSPKRTKQQVSVFDIYTGPESDRIISV
jgi:hypothetical protein